MAPFECEFDVGQAIAQHQVRAVAMAAAARVVDTVVTKGLGFAETVDVEIVQVTVSVTDGKNSSCVDCREAAFHVFEDGQPQTISHFVSEDIPLDLVLAVDVSSSMKDAMPKVKDAVKEFLAALTPRDQVSVARIQRHDLHADAKVDRSAAAAASRRSARALGRDRALRRDHCRRRHARPRAGTEGDAGVLGWGRPGQPRVARRRGTPARSERHDAAT